VFTKVTQGIRVSAMPLYVPEQSFPDENIYTWIYHIIIENQSNEAIQLIFRHWKIIDGYGELTEVRGKGVVGEQPVIKPGTAYEYTSSCQLKTNSGIMQGEYLLQATDNREFSVDIPAFSLDIPHNTYTIN
jgi:ApaG protein